MGDGETWGRGDLEKWRRGEFRKRNRFEKGRKREGRGQKSEPLINTVRNIRT